MKLSKDERKQLDTLFADQKRPGMILWMEPRNGDTYAKGFCQCDPFDAMAMASFAVEMFAACYGLEPKGTALTPLNWNAIITVELERDYPVSDRYNHNFEIIRHDND